MSTSLSSDICFVIRHPNIVWHKSANKQWLLKKTKINKHMCYIEQLVPHIKSDTTRCLHHTATSTMLKSTWSDMTRRLHHAEQVVPQVEMNTISGGRHNHAIMWPKICEGSWLGSCLPPRDQRHMTLVTWR